MQAYSDPKRESDPHALPDLEIFYISDHLDFEFHHGAGLGRNAPPSTCPPNAPCAHVGYYWWSCSPGCLPDGDATGPFPTAEEALADAREGLED